MNNLDEKEMDAAFDAAEETAEEYIKRLIDSGKFQFNSKHKTNLSYYYNKEDKSQFIEMLARELHFSFTIMEFKKKRVINQEQLDRLKAIEDLTGNEYDDEVFRFSARCGACDKYVRYTLKNGVVSSEDEDCIEIEPYSFEVAFPSGKVIFADWPEYASELLKDLDDDKVSINAFKGCVLRSQAYAKQNVLHVFVGNTCPHVYYKDGLIFIGRDKYEYDEELDEEFEAPLMPDAEQEDSICTDLWWATGVDYEVYKKMAIKKFGKKAGTKKIDELFKKDFMTVKPGIYKVTHYFDSARATTGEEPDLYTKLEWVREAK